VHVCVCVCVCESLCVVVGMHFHSSAVNYRMVDTMASSIALFP